MVEIDMETRTETGRVRLIQIAGPSRVCIQEQIGRHCIRGSLIFTDSHRSYLWLTSQGYVRRSVNHTQHEFSRMETMFGVEINVTTNPAKGLSGRVKTFCRGTGVKRVAQGNRDVLIEIWNV